MSVTWERSRSGNWSRYARPPFAAGSSPGKFSFIAPIVEAGRLNARAQRNQSDVDVVEVLVDLTDPGTLPVGMKVDVYFRPDK